MECCDGTGWTGNPMAPCATHYEPSHLSAISCLYDVIGV